MIIIRPDYEFFLIPGNTRVMKVEPQDAEDEWMLGGVRDMKTDPYHV